MTMDRTIHLLFGRFDLALEPTNQIHTYKIQTYISTHLPLSGFVTFTNYNARYELPSPALLEVHATIAKVLHATGRAEQADKIQRDKDDIDCLATDGSTDVAALLSVTSDPFLLSRSLLGLFLGRYLLGPSLSSRPSGHISGMRSIRAIYDYQYVHNHIINC